MFVIGWNVPGYLPDETFDFTTFEAAKQALADELERAMLSEESQNPVGQRGALTIVQGWSEALLVREINSELGVLVPFDAYYWLSGRWTLTVESKS